MSERTETPGWVIQAGENGEEFHISAGETVLIGRTPLRPVTKADSLRHITIDDPGKSMSKQHLKFVVRLDGSASLQDLHSTNGTYVVRASGDLLRLPLEQEYPLTQSSLKIQCGDLPLEIRREAVAAPAESEPTAVQAPSLFARPASILPEGVDSPSLSVDDILDLRAGEPTEMFDAKKVRHQVSAEAAAAAAPAFAGSDFARLKRDLEGRQAQAGSSDFTAQPFATDQQAADSDPAAGAGAAVNSPGQVAPTDSTLAADARFAPAVGADEAGLPGQAAQAAPAQVFESGSVFDRLTRGELGGSRPAVEIGELNSDDAQHSADQSLQFELAKHHEFLPFLALNPHLYDDLYAWLEAIGDPDITAALRSNSGYAAYREGRD